MTFFRFVGAAFLLALVMLTGSSMQATAGQREKILENVLALTGHLLIRSPETSFTDWEAVADRVSKVPGVRLAAPIVESPALASSSFNASSVLVRGIRASDLMKLTFVAMNVRQGTLDRFDDSQGIVVSSRLAERLSVQVGDTVTLVAPLGATTPTGASPRVWSSRIAAVFDVDVLDPAAYVFMPLTQAQSHFDRSADITGIEVHLNEADDVTAFRQRVTEAARRGQLS
jgi:lipoprotein-releasing system permease protein